MDIVSKRRLWVCAAVIAACVALNLLSPLIISSQRVLAPTQDVLRFDGPTALHRTITIEEEPAQKGLFMSAEVINDGELIASDRFEVNPSSAFPTSSPGSSRQGLGYVMPYAPERRSYPFYDPVGDVTVPLDYVGARSVGGLETYKYRAEIDVAGYRAERIIDVERRTGRLLDETWTVNGNLYVLSDATKATELANAYRDVRVLKALQIMAFLTRLIGVVAFFVALGVLWR